MKKIIKVLVLLVILSAFSMVAFADMGGNVDGGGGSLGQGTGESYWSPGKDGVRVTVVDLSGNPVSTPFDISNNNLGSNVRHFGKVSKVHYRTGSSLRGQTGGYSSYSIAGMPTIVSASGGSNIQAIKTFFTYSGTLMQIANCSGISYETLIGGDYKILLEPIAYFKYNGVDYAMTATEAGYFDQSVGGSLRSAMGTLTHQNLPLAMFLENADIGFRRYTGAGSGLKSRQTIISVLGVGVLIPFPQDVDIPTPEITVDETQSHYEFRPNKDVVISYKVTNNTGIDLKANKNTIARVSIIGDAGFTYNGTFNLNIPKNRSQLVWFKFTTPTTPQNLTMTVTINNNVTIHTPVKTASITPVNAVEPPDPRPTDTNKNWSLGFLPTAYRSGKLDWGKWEYGDTTTVTEGQNVTVFDYTERGSVTYGAWGNNTTVYDKTYKESDTVRLYSSQLINKYMTAWNDPYTMKWYPDSGEEKPKASDTFEYIDGTYNPDNRVYSAYGAVQTSTTQAGDKGHPTSFIQPDLLLMQQPYEGDFYTAIYGDWTNKSSKDYNDIPSNWGNHIKVEVTGSTYYPAVYQWSNWVTLANGQTVKPNDTSTMQYRLVNAKWENGYWYYGNWLTSTSYGRYPSQSSNQEMQITRTYTQYRYRTRKNVFSSWGSWSAWGNAYQGSSTNKQVETRTVYEYRYRTKYYVDGRYTYDLQRRSYNLVSSAYTLYTWREKYCTRPSYYKYYYRTRTLLSGDKAHWEYTVRSGEKKFVKYKNIYQTRTKKWSDAGSGWSTSSEWRDGTSITTTGWNWREYYLSTTPLTSLDPDSRVPTAKKRGNSWEIKSGYGVTLTVNPYVSGVAYSSDYSVLQTGLSLYPEFNYRTYSRLLEPVGNVLMWESNKYHPLKNRTQFTPLWYPDNTNYPIQTYLFDAWTPAGQLYTTVSNEVYINGNVYDDWYITK